MQIEFTTKSRALSRGILGAGYIVVAGYIPSSSHFARGVQNRNNEPECERKEGTEKEREQYTKTSGCIMNMP